MALPSAFRERLEHMEHTRNHRLSLLQAEKELQVEKSQQLVEKQVKIRLAEQMCLKLDQKIASLRYLISSIKSQIDELDSEYNDARHHISLKNLPVVPVLTEALEDFAPKVKGLKVKKKRMLKSKMEELEELEMEKSKFYILNQNEMDESSAQLDCFVVECGVQVQELRSSVNELKANFVKLEGNASAGLSNSDICAAEMRKSQLIASKENLDTSLASSYQIRAQLQKQLHRILFQKTKD